MINFDSEYNAEHFENDDMHESLLLYRILLGILASLMIRIIFPIQAQAVGAFPPPGLQKLTMKQAPQGRGSSPFTSNAKEWDDYRIDTMPRN